MRSARREFAAGAISGKIYVACGLQWSDPNAVTFVNTTEECDPAADSWTARAPCSAVPANGIYPNVHIAGAAANGKLYVIAFSVYANPTAATYEYDPAADTWTTKAQPPFTYASYAAAELGGSIYLLASAPGAAPQSKLAVFSPTDNVWVVGGGAFAGVWWSTLASANGKLYAIGGVHADGSIAGAVDGGVRQYDPAAGQWLQRGGLGVARRTAAAAAIEGGALYVVGGSSAASAYYPIPVGVVEAGVPTGL